MTLLNNDSLNEDELDEILDTYWFDMLKANTGDKKQIKHDKAKQAISDYCNRREVEGKYLVFDIGCIECGEESSVVGIYNTQEEAEKAKEEYFEPDTDWGKEEWHGQHHIEIFKLNSNPNAEGEDNHGE
jgi:hypothetical protein